MGKRANAKARARQQMRQRIAEHTTSRGKLRFRRRWPEGELDVKKPREATDADR